MRNIKQELIIGNTDKKVHLVVKDEESEERLSQGGDIGVHYLAKFRELKITPTRFVCLTKNMITDTMILLG